MRRANAATRAPQASLARASRPARRALSTRTSARVTDSRSAAPLRLRTVPQRNYAPDRGDDVLSEEVSHRHEYVEHKEKPAEPDATITNLRLESKPYILSLHRTASLLSDKVAYGLVKTLRYPTDLFFAKKYGHRAIVLETVAAVPGMVAGVMRHLRSLRRMSHDGGWIPELLDEAENERMHLLTFLKIQRPSLFERCIVASVQIIFFNVYFFAYLISPRTMHRFVGYLEEEAVVSYTQYLEQIDAGKIENVPAPKMAIEYWKLPEDAKLRDVVLAVRADEARHRDVNHRFADSIMLSQKPMLKKAVPLTREDQAV